ncbi:MAG: DUF455 family protein [Verrucomicrobiales bacterium]
MAGEEKSVREFAERVLWAETLAEKIAPAPRELVVGPPERGSFRAPDLPGRPSELRPGGDGRRARFPGRVETEEERARLLHFFANHELLAVELMALALLKFPDAPTAFRRGVLRTLREEQEHTRWYVERMAACGVTFGDYPVSGMIWNHIAEMESPLDYVSRLSLTFEQANLDYARHYAGVLAEAGDAESAAILGRIYHDEIAHVGYGLKWLRRWKQEKESDWDAWHRRLHLPLGPIRAKGSVPFNEEGRRKAGLDPEFIRNLKCYEATRGRTPDLWWFNLTAEDEWACERRGESWSGGARVTALAGDLELAFGAVTAAREDVLLLRRPPGLELREKWAAWGLVLPECREWQGRGELPEALRKRKMGRLRPWAEGPGLAEWATRHEVGYAGGRGDVLGKELAHRLRGDLAELGGVRGDLVHSVEEAREAVVRCLAEGFSQVLLKEVWGAAGRGCHLVSQAPEEKLLTRLLARAPLLVEPWLEKVLEFSFLGERDGQKGARLLSLSRQETDAQGRWLGSVSTAKVARGLPRELAEPLMGRVLPTFEKEVLPLLETRLAELAYEGPWAVDSFFYRQADGELAWQPVVELNGRWSMGRLAHEWRLKLCPDATLMLGTTKLKDLPDLPPPVMSKGRLRSGALILADEKTALARVPYLRVIS